MSQCNRYNYNVYNFYENKKPVQINFNKTQLNYNHGKYNRCLKVKMSTWFTEDNDRVSIITSNNNTIMRSDVQCVIHGVHNI